MSRRGGVERTEIQIASDKAAIASYYLQEYAQVEIAKLLHLSQQQVSLHIKELQDEWLSSAQVDFDQARAKQLAKINRLEREANVAWEKSKKQIQKTQNFAEANDKGELKPTRMAVNVEQTNGDTKYLAIVQWCISERNKILGLLAPTKTQITGPNGGPLMTMNLENLTDAELNQLIASGANTGADGAGGAGAAG